jgi:putative transposase
MVCAENVSHTLKVELIHSERFATHEQIRQAVFECFVIVYNKTRWHSAPGYISPEAFGASRVA